MSLERVHVVTDSTAAVAVSTGLDVVPLTVHVGGRDLPEPEVPVADVVAALAAGERVITAQPAPAALAAAYERARRAGATAVVSVHLSGELSGTVHAAALAASKAPLPVHVIDSRSAGLGLGFAAQAAAQTAVAGGGAAAVAERALRVAGSSRIGIVVDSLDHLRRGGRIGAATAALGTAFGVRPVLALRSGRLEVAQRVRSKSGLLDRLADAAERRAAALREPRVAVHWVDREPEGLADRLRNAGLNVTRAQLGGVLAAHLGPGAYGVVIAELAE